MKFVKKLLGTTLVGMLTSGAAHAITISVFDVVGGAQDLQIESLGAVTASTIGYGNHVVGPGGDVGSTAVWDRPIVQFPMSDFSSLSGLSIVSASLYYTIVSDFTESGESGTSEVRLFTTSETELNLSNRDVFAGLSGDGGAHSVVGSETFIDGMTGPQSLAFSPAALSALQIAINGSDPTLVISFREFEIPGGVGRADLLDEFVLGVPPGNMSIKITAIPEPTALVVLLIGGSAVLCGRHCRR
ncbi:MAG: hypothetical protein IT447_15115 [Phycisphaerales bacterium]|nr:hypothetical protein [Phycisphaerales bacterium]